MRTCSNASGSATSPYGHPSASGFYAAAPIRATPSGQAQVLNYTTTRPPQTQRPPWLSLDQRRVVSSSSTLSVPEITIEPPVSSLLSARAQLTRFPVPPRINRQPHPVIPPSIQHAQPQPRRRAPPYACPLAHAPRRGKEGTGAGQRVQGDRWLRIRSWIWVW
jgi:hypothetical protein